MGVGATYSSRRMRAVSAKRRAIVTRRLLARLITIARFVAVIVAIQISGLSHGVTDALASMGVIEEHSDDCGDEPGDRDCPPGCPTCHCTDCGTTALPPVRGTLLPLARVEIALPIDGEGRAPSPPDLPSVYRPPRHVRLT